MSEPTDAACIRQLMRSAREHPRRLGRLFQRVDRTGHTLLCRLLHAVAHHGKHATFVLIDQMKLKHGGSLCSFGAQCGEPKEHYMREMNERMEQFARLHRILKASGALVSHVWENPRFSVGSLCRCGHEENRDFPVHDPLCPYRIEWGIQPTIEEYKAVRSLQ